MPGHGAVTPLPEEVSAADARGHLDRVAGRLAGYGLAATGNVVVDDRPVAAAIAGYAERTGAELVTLSTRSRGPLSRLFRGSLAEEVACRVGVPVLISRAQVGRTADQS
jgi:nucleotide-binding universal stress UspA family protein